MSDVVGSLLGVNISGIQYRVKADADISMKFSSFEKEGIATSGATLFKMTIVNPTAEGVPLAVNGDQIEALIAVGKQTANTDISVTLASGDEWKCQGQINLGDYSTAEGTAEVNLIPSNAILGWSKF